LGVVCTLRRAERSGMQADTPKLQPPDPGLPGIDQLIDIVAKLRGPGGCPWDREQTHSTLRAGLLEEAHEVVAAINAGDDANLREELGDLLLQSVFHAQLAREEGRFDFDAVAREIATKLVRRHPHVFGEDHCADADAVLTRWDEIKRAEKGGAAASALDGLPAGLPALLHAQKVQKKAAKVGFDWPDAAPVIEKVREEIAEVEAEIATAPERLEDEIGDLLFTVVNLARKLRIDSETALHRATEKFSGRFRAVEALARERGLALEKMTLAELDTLWDEVKARATAGD
jgi:MazG family protein